MARKRKKVGFCWIPGDYEIDANIILHWETYSASHIHHGKEPIFIGFRCPMGRYLALLDRRVNKIVHVKEMKSQEIIFVSPEASPIIGDEETRR